MIEELIMTAGSDVAPWLEHATTIRKTLGLIPGGAALSFPLIRLPVLLALSELKEKRICSKEKDYA